MKRIDLIHKEKHEECFEILKSNIIEDKELKKFRIDKDTLLHELPESIVNEFLDFLSTDEQHRSLILQLIKSGSLVIHCWEDENDSWNSAKANNRIRKEKLFKGVKGNYDDTFDKPTDNELPF